MTVQYFLVLALLQPLARPLSVVCCVLGPLSLSPPHPVPAAGVWVSMTGAGRLSEQGTMSMSVCVCVRESVSVCVNV